MFKLNDIIFDRVVSGLILNKQTGVVERYLSQLQTLNLETNSDPTEIKDKDGNVVYRKYTGKTLAVSATNAFVSNDILGLASGSETLYASETDKLVFPRVEELAGDTVTYVIKDMVDGTLHVNALSNSGVLGEEFKLATSASANSYAITTSDGITTVTLPTESSAQKFLVTYKRIVKSGQATRNDSDKFPETTELLFKALAVDPCDKKLRACYISIPAFMADPSVALEINNSDASTMEFKGAAMLDMCSKDRSLYTIMFAEDDIED